MLQGLIDCFFNNHQSTLFNQNQIQSSICNDTINKTARTFNTTIDGNAIPTSPIKIAKTPQNERARQEKLRYIEKKRGKKRKKIREEFFRTVPIYKL
jgi:hypothetical protein